MSDYARTASDAKEMLIGQLRREIRELSEAQERAEDLRTRLDSLTHLHDLLAEEKRRSDDDAHEKQQKMAKTIAGLRAEVESLTLRNQDLEYQVQNLQRQNDWFEESMTRKGEELGHTENELKKEAEARALLEDRVQQQPALTRLEKELNAHQGEKGGLREKFDEQQESIEELIEGMKDRERLINELEQERDGLEETIAGQRKDIERREKEHLQAQDLIKTLGEKLENSGKELADLESDLSSHQKELEVTREELRQAKRKIESLRQENAEVDVEVKRQMRMVEEGQDRIDELTAKVDELTKERISLQTKLSGTKTEADMSRRENERLLISQKDVGWPEQVADEVGRFGSLNNSIKQEMLKKKSLLEHKSEADRELRRALEQPPLTSSLTEALYQQTDQRTVASTAHRSSNRSNRTVRFGA